MTHRREITLTGMLCLVGSTALLLAAQFDWVSYRPTGVGGSGTATATVEGAAAPVTRALGVAALAGVIAIVATRGRGRTAVGAALVLVGVAAIAAGTGAGANPIPLAGPAIDLPAGAVWRSTPWPWVAAAGGASVVLAGVLVAARGSRWVSMSTKYESPTGTRPGTSDAGQWEALSRGDDPTL